MRFLFRIPTWFLIIYCGLAAWATFAFGEPALPTALYPVGVTQMEYVDPAGGGRSLNYMLIYPAAPDASATPFKIFLSTKLHLYKDAPIVADGLKHPLIMFSHGAGG